jgi:hypothetical protein
MEAKPEGPNVHVRMDPAEKALFQRVARAQNVTLSEALREGARRYLGLPVQESNDGPRVVA